SNAIAIRLEYLFEHRIHKSTRWTLKVSGLYDCHGRVDVSASRIVIGADSLYRLCWFGDQPTNIRTFAESCREFRFQTLLVLLLKIITDLISHLIKVAADTGLVVVVELSNFRVGRLLSFICDFSAYNLLWSN